MPPAAGHTQRWHTAAAARDECLAGAGAALCAVCAGWRRCWKKPTLGEKQGEIRWDNQLQYLKASD